MPILAETEENYVVYDVNELVLCNVLNVACYKYYWKLDSCSVNISLVFIKHSCNKVITNPPILQHVSIIHEYYKAVRNTIFF